MRQISFWASRHTGPARIIIVTCIVLLHILAMSMGDLFEEMGYHIPFNLFYLPAAISIYAFVLYPYAADRSRYRSFYVVRKTFDSLLVCSTFFMLLIGANNARYVLPAFETVNVTGAAASVTIEKPAREKKEKKLSVKNLRKKMIDNVQTLRKLYRDGTKGEKAALIILSVLVALGLLMLIAMLSCNLSCGGSDVAAALVGLGGTALVVFLFVRVIRGLNRKYRQKANS
jgi:small-conductance mechanosensitive channel